MLEQSGTGVGVGDEQQQSVRMEKPRSRTPRSRWRGSTAPFLEVGDEEVQRVDVVVEEE